MRLSRYNFVFPLEDGQFLAYNALTNGLALVDASYVDVLSRYSPEAFAALDGEVQRELERGGFVIPDELDERDVVRVRFRAAQYAGGSLGVTVCPTLACNLACRYCFESNFRGVMSERTEDALVRFVDERLPEKGGNLGVVWYGGEPLLALEVVARLTEKLMDVCQRKEAAYHATVITNRHVAGSPGRGAPGAFARRVRPGDP